MSDDKLIIAVSSFPCIYDVSLDKYRDNLMRNEAWRKIRWRKIDVIFPL